MPRRTSRKPQAASRPQPPSGLRAAFICRKPGPSLRKGARGGHPAARESGLRPAEGHPGRSLRSVRRRAFREYRAAGGGAAGPRGVRMPHFPALKGKQPPAASRPREAATLRRTSAHRLSARTVPRRRIRSPPEPDSLTPGRGVRPFRAPSCRTFPPEIRRFAPRDGGLNRYILEFGIFSLYLHVERAIRFE